MGMALLPGAVTGAISTWDGSVNNTWSEADNWTPAGVPDGTGQIVIDNGDTVSRTGSISLFDADQGDDGLLLTNGTLNVSGDFTATTNGGNSSSYTNFFGVSGGSSSGILSVNGTLGVGASASTGSSVIFDIYQGSSVSAGSFSGLHGGGSGGYIFNLLGGQLSVTNTFEWTTLPGDADGRGRLILGSTSTAVGGSINVGTMSSNWDAKGDQYVLFNDNLGSLTFGKTNYATITDVQNLIDNQFIRKDVSVTEDFSIADNGSSWTVTVVPEPGATGLIVAGLAFSLLALRRRRS